MRNSYRSLAHNGLALCVMLSTTTARPAWFPATLPKASAKMEMEFPYPFELVLHTWENGPADPQFLREDVQTKKIGNAIEKTKTIYTKNPFPYLIQKTLIREPELVFLEEQRINMREKIVQYWSVNKCLEYVGKAYRTSTIRAHPTKPGFTLVEQTGGVQVSIPGALKGPVENFACSAFIDVCKQALHKLNVTLQNSGRGAVREGSAAAPLHAAASEGSTVEYSSTDGALHGLGLVLGGLCCKVLLARSARGANTAGGGGDSIMASAAAGKAQEPMMPLLPTAAKPPSARHTPPFRAAAAAFAVALVSTQLM